MNKLVAALSLTTVLFAASTIYLAQELYSRDAQPGTAMTAANPATSPAGTEGHLQSQAASSGGLPQSAAGNAATAPAAGAAKGAPATPEASAPQKTEVSEGTLMWARPFLARFDDSAQHDVLLDETKTGIRRQYSKLKEQLKLSDSTFEQLITQLAEETLQLQEQFARCAVNPECNVNDPSRRAYVDHSQEYLALLGSDGIEAFTQFRSSIGERDQVIQLRGRLPDSNFLPESQAEQLIKALADERNLFQQEAMQHGASVKGWGTPLGMLYFSADSGSIDQQISEARQYSQRMRTRAAEVLSPAQLAAYVQMQDELLAQLTSTLRPPARKTNTASSHAT